MTTAIVYYSKHHGNTKKLLDAIAASDAMLTFANCYAIRDRAILSSVIVQMCQVNNCKYVSRKYIEVVTHREYIEKYRMQRVYKPAVLKRIVNSKQWWWGDLDFDRERIIEYLDFLNPEEAEKEKANKVTDKNI